MEYVFNDLVEMMSEFRVSAVVGVLCLTKLFHVLDGLSVVHGGFKVQIGKTFLYSVYSSLVSSSSVSGNVMRNWASLCYARMELLNTLLEKSMKNKQILLNERGSDCELVKKLYRSVDGNSQLLLIEALWRLIMPQRKTENDRIATAAVAFKVVAHSHTRTMLIQQFLKISTNNFDESLRTFLLRFNELRPNMSHSRSRLVWSFATQYMTIQGQKFENKKKTLWIDLGLYAFTTRLPDPHTASFHYTVSIPIAAITHQSLHSPHKSDQKGKFQITRLLSLTLSLDKLSPDSPTSQPLLPPDIIDTTKQKDITIEILLSQKDSDHFSSLITSRLRNAPPTNASTLSVLGSSTFSHANSSRRASHHGGTISSEITNPSLFLPPRSSFAPSSFQPQAHIGPISSSPTSKLPSPFEQENDHILEKLISPSHSLPHVYQSDPAGMIDHGDAERMDVGPEPIDELLSRLDDMDSLDTPKQVPKFYDHHKTPKSQEKLSAQKSSSGKKKNSEKSPPIAKSSPPPRASFHESIANISMGLNPIVQTPTIIDTGIEKQTPKSPSIFHSTPSSPSEIKEKANRDRIVPPQRQKSPERSTRTSPNSDTTAALSPCSPPIVDHPAPIPLASPASLVSQLSLYPLSPVPAPQLSSPTPAVQTRSPNQHIIPEPSSPILRNPISQEEERQKPKRSEKKKPKPFPPLGASKRASETISAKEQVTSSSKKRKRDGQSEQPQQKTQKKDFLTDPRLDKSKMGMSDESDDSEHIQSILAQEMAEESPPASKRPKSEKKAVLASLSISSASPSSRNPEPSPKTPNHTLISTVAMRFGVPPGAPLPNPPPSILGTPNSPSAPRLVGGINAMVEGDSEMLARQLFPPEKETPSVQIQMELQEHVAKLLTLIERESDAIAGIAEKRKMKLKEAWTRDLEEMRSVTHNAHLMLDKVFNIAVGRAQDTVDASGVSFEEFNAMSEQYQSFITKIVDATAHRLSTL